MFKRIIKIVSALIFVSALAFLCALFAFPSIGAQKSDKEAHRYGVLELRGAYRNSSAVVEGVCLSSYLSPYGSPVSNYSVEKVLSGKNIAEGDVISVNSSDVSGSRRILYLANAIGDVHSENSEVYNIVEGGMLAFDGKNIMLPGSGPIPVELMENDIVKLKEEMQIPSKYYCYDDIKSLVDNCSTVLVGRVESIEVNEGAELFTNHRGEVVRMEGDYTRLRVRVMNGLYWQNSFGEMLDVRLVSGSENSVLDAKTNNNFVYTHPAPAIEKGKVYIFFLKRSPDEKESFFFPVNAYQGFIETMGEEVLVPEANRAFYGVTSFDKLVDLLRKASGIPLAAVE